MTRDSFITNPWPDDRDDDKPPDDSEAGTEVDFIMEAKPKITVASGKKRAPRPKKPVIVDRERRRRKWRKWKIRHKTPGRQEI